MIERRRHSLPTCRKNASAGPAVSSQPMRLFTAERLHRRGACSCHALNPTASNITECAQTVATDPDWLRARRPSSPSAIRGIGQTYRARTGVCSTPSRPCFSATRSNAWPSSKASECNNAEQPKRLTRACSRPWRAFSDHFCQSASKMTPHCRGCARALRPA